MRIAALLVFSLIVPGVTFGDASFKLTVIDSEGAAIGGAMVMIHWDSAGSTVGVTTNVGIKQDMVARTGEDGTVKLDLPPGFYDVFVAAMAFSPTCRKIRTKTGKTVDIVLRMNADPLYTAEMGDRVDAVRPAKPRPKK